MNLFVLCLSLSVVAALLCIVLSSEASNIMQCTEDRQSDGQFYFSMSYDVKEDVRDCETQWLVDVYILCIYV